MYYSEVHPGDTFRPDSVLANDIRRLLNADPLQGDSAGQRPVSPDITVCVRNAGTAALAADQPVQFPGGAPVSGEIVPVCGFTDAANPWGVLLGALGSGEIGECLLHGVATVALNAGTGRFAQPAATGFTRGTAGLPILAEFADGTVARAIVSVPAANIGGGSVSPACYAGPFAVTLNGGSTAVIAGGNAVRADAEDAVPGGSVTVSGTASNVYCVARYRIATGAVTYAFEAAAGISAIVCPAGYTQYVTCIARVSGGTATQIQYGDIIVMGVWL